MKKTYFVVASMLSLSVHADDFLKNGNPCINSVCINDDIMSIQQVNWQEAKNMLGKPVKSMKINNNYLSNVMKKLAPQDKNTVVNAAPYIISGSFDSTGIAALTKIKGYCEAFPLAGLKGEFKSASGYTTVVYADVIPSADGKNQTINVRSIRRQYPNELTTEQANQLEKQFEMAYSSIKRASFSDLSVPTWDFTPYKKELVLFAPNGDSRKRQDILRQYPGCSVNLSIN